MRLFFWCYKETYNLHHKNVEKWFDRLPLGARPSLSEIFNEFFNAFSNESDAFAAISYIGSKIGLNFPTVEVMMTQF